MNIKKEINLVSRMGGVRFREGVSTSEGGERAISKRDKISDDKGKKNIGKEDYGIA